MGTDEAPLLRLWREKRGEVEPEDLPGNLLVQLGLATEALKGRWYQSNTGQVIADIQKRIRNPALRWMVATLDGRVQGRLRDLTPIKPSFGAAFVAVPQHRRRSRR